MPAEYMSNEPNKNLDVNMPISKKPDYITGDFSFHYPKNLWETLSSLNENLETKLL